MKEVEAAFELGQNNAQVFNPGAKMPANGCLVEFSLKPSLAEDPFSKKTTVLSGLQGPLKWNYEGATGGLRNQPQPCMQFFDDGQLPAEVMYEDYKEPEEILEEQPAENNLMIE